MRRKLEEQGWTYRKMPEESWNSKITYNIYTREIILLLMLFSHAQISYETIWKTNLPTGNQEAKTLFSDNGNKDAHWPFPRGNRLAKFSL